MYLTKRNIHLKLFMLFILSGTVLQSAVLDDLFKSIEHQTAHKKHHRSHHRKHRYHAISDEKKWQTALKFLGYYQGKINGDLLTPESYKAIKNFQQRDQYFAAGILEDDSKRYLSQVYKAIRLRNYLDYEGKNRKKNRKKIQAALSIEGVYQGKIDGVTGKKTKNSILLYKKSLDQNTTEGSQLNKEEREQLIAASKDLLEERLAKFKQETSFSPNKSAEIPEEEAVQKSIGKSSMADILDSGED